MKSQFRSVFYLRSNYINKEGKTPVLIRIYLNKERLSLGSTGLAVNPIQWDSEKEKVKGHSAEALEVNRKIEEIRADILTIYKRLEVTVDDLTPERIKSEYFGTSDTLTSYRRKGIFSVSKSSTCCLRSRSADNIIYHSPYRRLTMCKKTPAESQVVLT